MSKIKQSPEDHLLRTLAAVPVQSRILHLGCQKTRQIKHLAQLGFDLYACDVVPEALMQTRKCLEKVRPEVKATDRVVSATAASLAFPDDAFDWIVAHNVFNRAAALANVVEMLSETKRVLKPGGWMHCVVREQTAEQENWKPLDSLVYQNGSKVGAFFTKETLGETMEQFDLAEAEAPFSAEINNTSYLCGTYRKVNEQTPL